MSVISNFCLLMGAIGFSGCTVARGGYDRIIFPQAELEGQPVRLALDTGTSTTLILRSTAQRSGLEFSGALKSAANWNDQDVGLALAPQAHLTIGPSRYVGPLPVGILPVMDVDGVVGWPEIKDNILVFDPRQHRVSASTSLPDGVASWLKLPLGQADGVLTLQVPLGNGQMGTILVDTGADDGIALAPAEWNALSKAQIAPAAGALMDADGLGHKEIVMNEIKLGAITLYDVPVHEAEATDRSAVGSIPLMATFGLHALERMELVLDGKGGFAYLRPLESVRPPAAESSPLLDAAPRGPPPHGNWTADETMRIDNAPLLVLAARQQAWIFFDRGTAKAKAGDLKGGIADLSHALELDPTDEHTYYNRGLAELSGHDLERAAADFTRAIELGRTTANVYLNRGVARLRLRENAGAIADFTRAIELDPRNSEAYLNRGTAEVAAGDFAQAIADLNRAMELGAKSQWVYYERGLARQNRGDFSAALDDFLRSAQLAPNDSAYAEMYAYLLQLRLGKPPNDLAKQAAGWTDDWPRTIAAYLTGQLAENDLWLAAEKPESEKADSTSHREEARYFAGERQLLRGNFAQARQLLTQAATDEQESTFRLFARTELARLNAAAEREPPASP